jgi:hypothetical protein
MSGLNPLLPSAGIRGGTGELREANRIWFINIKPTLRVLIEWTTHFNKSNGLACKWRDWIGLVQEIATAFNFDVP